MQVLFTESDRQLGLSALAERYASSAPRLWGLTEICYPQSPLRVTQGICVVPMIFCHTKPCKCDRLQESESLPRTMNGLSTMTLQKRVPIRIPGPMMNEVDRIVREHPELNYNRQQFVESSVREKIERIIMLEGAKSNTNQVTIGNRIKHLY
jgi:hypothetical protein